MQQLLESEKLEEISFASEASLRAVGKCDAANVIKELSAALPTRL
jgi:hypothetical protein